MAGKQNDRGISRREFTATLGAVAGLTAGANLLTPETVHAAPHINPRIIGARWQTNGESLGIKITEGLFVSAHYESAAWPIDAEKRRQ